MRTPVGIIRQAVLWNVSFDINPFIGLEVVSVVLLGVFAARFQFWGADFPQKCAF